jgi:hypothetical protein
VEPPETDAGPEETARLRGEMMKLIEDAEAIDDRLTDVIRAEL